MTFKEYCEYLEKLEKLSSRLAITSLVVELLKRLRKDEIRVGIYLMLGELAPQYEAVRFAMADKMVVRALAEVSGEKIETLTKMYKQLGDLGLLAKETRTLVKKEENNLNEIYKILREIAEDAGEGSQERKVEKLAKLIGASEDLPRKYIARMVMGKLRLGFSDKTILDALSVLENGDKSARKTLDAVYQIRPDVGYLAEEVKEFGIKVTGRRVRAKVGVPVIPALCQRLNTADEIVEKMGEVGVERKYDGTRVQIHATKKSSRWEIRTFTRNLEENSWMFPELDKLGEYLEATNVILDSEAVGYDKKTDKVLPFQVTITRKRKHGIEEASKSVPLRFFVFDILVKDDADLLNEPYEKRREILKKTIKKNEIAVVDETYKTQEASEVHKLHEHFLKEGYEGAVIKKWDGNYLPGRQGWNWVKIKESEGTTGKLTDTLDLIVMGYYRGKGKRSGFGIGAFLVGTLKGEKILTIAKIGTGLSDKTFRDLKKRLDALVISTPPKQYEVNKGLVPDVWVDPEIVVEIAADEITKSPIHTAGVALRFPRLIKFRDDKGYKDATTLEEVKKIGKVQ